MTDWTPVIGGYIGCTGVAEYRVENDGLVRWRGLITKTTVIAGGATINDIPVESRPLNPPIQFDWSGDNADINTGCFGSFFYVAYHNTNLPTVDMSQVVYYGTPPALNPHTLAGVQAGLSDAIRGVTGLRVYDFPSDRVETPAAVLSLPQTPYDITLGGRSDEWTFPLWVLVAKADDKAAYGEMVSYLEAEGTKSIRAIIEADRTLGGACDTVAVIGARPLFATIAGTEFLAVEFTLEVYT